MYIDFAHLAVRGCVRYSLNFTASIPSVSDFDIVIFHPFCYISPSFSIIPYFSICERDSQHSDLSVEICFHTTIPTLILSSQISHSDLFLSPNGNIHNLFFHKNMIIFFTPHKFISEMYFSQLMNFYRELRRN